MNVDIAFGIEGDKVVMQWQEPTNRIEFDHENAFEFGELLARKAHEAKFGTVPTDLNYLAAQVKARVTDQLRERMIMKAAFDMRSLVEQKKTPGQIAVAIVDAILQEVA